MISRYYSLQQRLLLLLFFSAVATAILAPLGFNNFLPNAYDYFNHLAAIFQANLALSQGQFPLRTAPLEEYGWGYPFFQFYSSTSYFIAALIYRWLTASNLLLAYKLTMWLALVVGGIYMYRLAYWFVRSVPAAILAGLVFMTSPYFFIIINRYGAFNECISLGLFPAAAFYTFMRFFSPEKDRRLLQVSLVWFLMASTHVLTFMWATLTIFGFLFVVMCRNLNKLLSNFLRALLAYALGVLLAMWILGPIVSLLPYLEVNKYIAKSIAILANTPLSGLFALGINVSKDVSQLSMLTVHPAIGLPILSGVAICLYALTQQNTSTNYRPTYFLFVLLGLFFVLFLLAWNPVDLWQFLPRFFVMTQYTARLLGPLTVVGSLLFAWAVCWLFDGKLNAKHAILGSVLIILSSSSWYALSTLEYIDFKDTPVVKTHAVGFNMTSYIVDYMKFKHFDAVDNLLLNTIIFNDNLLVNKNYKLPINLFRQVKNPTFTVKGVFTQNLQGSKLSCFIDGKKQAETVLQGDHVVWNFALPVWNKRNTHEENWRLAFILKNKQNQVLTNEKNDLAFSEVSVHGYLASNNVLRLHQVEPVCHQSGIALACDIDVPANVKLIELPMLFYPDMLKVAMNGKEVDYVSVLYGNRLLAAVKPTSRKVHITAEFRGFYWANILSAMSWGLWGLFLVYLALQWLTVRVKQKNVLHKREHKWAKINVV